MEDISWEELGRQFGEEAVQVLDRAISETVSEALQAGPIRRGEAYLVSERLTYQVLLAMRDAGLRFTGAVQGIGA